MFSKPYTASIRQLWIGWKFPLLSLILTLLAVLLFSSLAPVEQVLGKGARIVYLHGAWVWAGLVTIVAAGMTGILGLLTRRKGLYQCSRAIGRTGLVFWLVNLPLSLYLMQANWNGLFLLEPRWRIPFTFAIVGILLQAGLSLMKPVWSAALNPLYALVLCLSMQNMETILHPNSPVSSSNSMNIRLFWAILFALLVLTAFQVSALFQVLERRNKV